MRFAARYCFALLWACALMRGQTGAGEKIFNSSCAACHSLDGHGGGHAPNIAGGSAAQSYSDERIAGIIHNGIPSLGMPAFASLTQSDIQAVVQHLRGLQKVGAVAASVPGDAQSGRDLFFGKAECSKCHLAGGSGGFIASDLTATRLTPAAIREAIVNPPQTSGNHITNVILQNGAKLSGIVRNEDNFSLQLQNTAGAYYLLDKSRIKTVERLDETLMPADYAKRLTAVELNDIQAFIVGLRSKP